MIQATKKWPHWTTPRSFLELLRPFGPIALDPCGNPHDQVGAAVSWWGLSHPGEHGVDGLAESWADAARGGLAFFNPPYSLAVVKWAAKAVDEARAGAELIGLLPARTDPAWAHANVFGAADAWLLWRGRLQFENPPPDVKGGGSNVPSLVAYYGRRIGLFRDVFGPRGALVMRAGRRAA